ncbi:MAG: hypothetical protein ACJ74H_16395 [Thermoanaerobaculia bacterium]
MTFMLVSSIVNYERSARLAQKFEDLLDRYKARLAEATRNFEPSGDLKQVYVQYQFDAEGAPNATRGFKIGRYSAKHQHLEATIEVTRKSFENGDDRSLTILLASLMIEALRQMNTKLNGKIATNFDRFVAIVEEDAKTLEAH